MNKEYREFPVTIYGNMERYNDVLTKARCRIFYKYGNRNGTYITDEFAEKLVSSLSYVPLKGIFKEETEDFSDHGLERNEGRIYGIVPENPNFAWEPHLDEDGVERVYACADVLIFTALYDEATEIVGKAQSMELYEPSIHFHRAVIKGQQYIVFEDGCFLGLQVLGDTVEPCFEGAAFYELRNSIENIISQIEKYGGQKMQKINFRLSDDQKWQALWSLLNSDYESEDGWDYRYNILSVYDDYALCYDCDTLSYIRAYYTKNDEEDSIVIDNIKSVFVMDVTEEEKATVDMLRKLNGDTYELVSETLINAEENLQKNSEFETQIEELNGVISTLNTEKDEMTENLAALNANLEAANSELESLKEYKLQIETAEKNAVIDQYVTQLSNEVLDSYRERINEFTAIDLDKELAYELRKTNPSIYSNQQGVEPKEQPRTGIEAILDRYI